MRLFFGIDLDPEAKLKVQSWREQNIPALLNPVPPANYHITLAFIGDIQDKQLEHVVALTDTLMSKNEIKGQELQVNQLGFWAKPGVVWIGPKTWPEGLTKLAKNLNTVGSKLGAKKEKRAYQPHITLSRNAEFTADALLQPDIKMKYNEFHLFESVQGKGSRRYESVMSWQLNRINRFI